jgi:hypothetical protein
VRHGNVSVCLSVCLPACLSVYLGAAMMGWAAAVPLPKSFVPRGHMGRGAVEATGVRSGCGPPQAVVHEEVDLEHGEVDEDGGDLLDFGTLVAQMFEVLLTLLGNRRYQSRMAPTVQQLAYLSIGTPSHGLPRLPPCRQHHIAPGHPHGPCGCSCSCPMDVWTCLASSWLTRASAQAASL